MTSIEPKLAAFAEAGLKERVGAIVGSRHLGPWFLRSIFCWRARVIRSGSVSSKRPSFRRRRVFLSSVWIVSAVVLSVLLGWGFSTRRCVGALRVRVAGDGHDLGKALLHQRRCGRGP